MSAETEIEFTLMMQIDVRNPFNRLVINPWQIGWGRFAFSEAGLNRGGTLNVFKLMARHEVIGIDIPSYEHKTIHRLFELFKQRKKIYEIELIAKSKTTSDLGQMLKRESQYWKQKAEPLVFADLTLNDVKINKIVPVENQQYDVVFDAREGTHNLVTASG